MAASSLRFRFLLNRFIFLFLCVGESGKETTSVAASQQNDQFSYYFSLDIVVMQSKAFRSFLWRRAVSERLPTYFKL